MQNVKIAKWVANAFVGAGTAKITHAIITNNVEPETVTDKVTVAAGTAAISGMAVEKTKAYTNAKIDEFVASWNDRKKKKHTHTSVYRITDLRN